KFALVDAQFSGDSRELVTLREDGLVEGWSLRSRRLDWRGRDARRIALAPRGNLAAIVKFNGRRELRAAHLARIVTGLGCPALARAPVRRGMSPSPPTARAWRPRAPMAECGFGAYAKYSRRTCSCTSRSLCGAPHSPLPVTGSPPRALTAQSCSLRCLPADG